MRLIDSQYLVPALKLHSDDLWEVTESTAFWGTRKMSRGRYLELFRGALVKCGVDPAQAQRATFNRLRRCFPTMANALRLPPSDMQAIGNWVEIPEGKEISGERVSQTDWVPLYLCQMM